MDSIRNIFSLSININNSERDQQQLYSSNNTINIQYSTSKTQRTENMISGMLTETDEEKPENDDCFIKFGLASSSEEKTSKTQIEENENEQNQPAHLVEEIDTIIALIIYNTYSKKHESTFNRQHRIKNNISPNSIHDDIDRFDGIYSCLIDQYISSKKSHFLSNYLYDRFFSLSNINKLKTFQQNEQSRISKEKKTNLNRVRFIPNILSYQRRCPYYNLNEMKWIRDHLC